MKSFYLNNIDSSLQSYEQLIDFYYQTKNISFDTIEITLNDWFAANMSAVLGGILDEIAQINEIQIKSSNEKIISILQRNSFLSGFGYETIYDINNTTIKYLKLKPSESRYFYNYIANDLLEKIALPSMSKQLKQKISESIYEIFVNAQIHSQSEYIFVCGQFFPKKHKIEFTIVDMGIGFKKNINSRFNKNMDAAKAIEWAINEGHTTKNGIPGGIGLAVLKEFILRNKGKFQIISDDGLYELGQERKSHLLSRPFPGTIVNMQFRTDDVVSYHLRSEINLSDIF